MAMANEATMLRFDWEEVEGATVIAVRAKEARGLNDGSLECRELALVLGANAVVIRVSDDTDEVIVTLEDFVSTGEWQPLEPLREIEARSLGWCWMGHNYRGYLDTFTIALDGIDPAFSFTGVASALQCARLTSIAA